MPYLFRQAAVLLTFILIFSALPASANEPSSQQTLTTHNGDEFAFEVFNDPTQKSKLRILWVAPSFGIGTRIQQTTEALAKLGAEVWLIDLTDALFLPKGAVSLRGISGNTVADIINALTQQHTDDLDILVVSSSYGAIPALRGVHAWQTQKPRQGKVIGTILFSPSFFTHVPELGVPPTFINELASINSPVYILQAAHNGNRWHLPAVLEELKNATVYSEILKGVRSVFYKRDQSPSSLAAFQEAPQMILRAARQLSQHHMPTNTLNTSANLDITSSGINTRLRDYRGKVSPTPIKLRDASNKHFDIHNYKGKITLINFWASWCPPCVEEIPSLNRLKSKMKGKPFQLISVNYAETSEKIRAFLAEVNVDFPVLVDPDGEVTSRWNIVAFPSTFVIGPDGKIHFGVNAAIHWDAPEVIQQLDQLLPMQQN